MPQPVKHDAEAMLDAVRELVLSGGPREANAAAVARLLGAPSGSIYHRFRNRDELVAAAWLRAQQRFLQGLLPRIDRASREHLREAARYVVSWSRDNPRDAALLVRYALHDLVPRERSQALDEQMNTANELLRIKIHQAADAVGLVVDDVLVVVVDLPYAIVQRRLTAGAEVQDGDVDVVGRAAACLLGLDR